VNSGISWRCSSQPVLFELVVAEQGALLVSASMASVLCAEHRRGYAYLERVTLEESFLTGRRLV
jgi:hypothetical protein